MHFICYSRWYENSPTCPVCRGVFTEEEDDFAVDWYETDMEYRAFLKQEKKVELKKKKEEKARRDAKRTADELLFNEERKAIQAMERNKRAKSRHGEVFRINGHLLFPDLQPSVDAFNHRYGLHPVSVALNRSLPEALGANPDVEIIDISDNETTFIGDVTPPLVDLSSDEENETVDVDRFYIRDKCRMAAEKRFAEV